MPNAYINRAIIDKTPVRVWVTKGAQLHGVIRSQDEEAIYLDVRGETYMIFKHAISTIAPEV